MISIGEKPSWGTWINQEYLLEQCEVDEKEGHNLKDSISQMITCNNKVLLEDLECHLIDDPSYQI